MAKSAPVKYSDPERFKAEFKDRQSEIKDEIHLWSQSESFRLKVREEVLATVKDHDHLTNLSKRLFENGIFISSFEVLTKKEVDSYNRSRWWERWSKWAWLLAATILGGIITLAIEFFCSRPSGISS